MLRLVAACFAALVATLPLAAQSVAGKVLEDRTDQPVLGVLVELRSDRGERLDSSVTDSSGEFRFTAPQAGIYRLAASRVGYQAVVSTGFQVGSEEAVEADLHISATAVLLSPLTITSRPEPVRSRYLETVGFYERERRSTGTFVDRERLDRSNGARLSDLLSELPGVRRLTVRGVAIVSLNRQRACSPQVVLDGQPLVESIRIDDIIAVRAIEAMEIYRGPAETPVQFANREQGCGMLVIWTRDRV